MEWSYGVTSVASRAATLLPRTITSLAKAGFTEPRLFFDGLPGALPGEVNCLPKTIRDTSVRTAGHWVLSAYELYLRNPQADRFAIFQDDLVTYLNLREYLERARYPEPGYLNLLTYPENHRLAPDARGWHLSNQLGRGATALVFNRPAITALLSQTYLVSRPQDKRKGWKSIDGGIVCALKNAGFKEYVHNPSLIQHTGEVSSMGNRVLAPADTFMGEEFDALSLLNGV